MGYDFELEDILSSIKEDRGKSPFDNDEAPAPPRVTPPKPVAPPKPAEPLSQEEGVNLMELAFSDAAQKEETSPLPAPPKARRDVPREKEMPKKAPRSKAKKQKPEQAPTIKKKPEKVPKAEQRPKSETEKPKTPLSQKVKLPPMVIKGKDAVNKKLQDIKKKAATLPHPAKKEKAPDKARRIRLTFGTPKIVKEVAEELKRLPFKKLGIAAAVIVLIVAAVVGGTKYRDFKEAAEIKQYEQKYDIKLPKGMLPAFYDDYGKNRNFVGKLVIEDTKTDVDVYASYTKGGALLDKGSSVFSDQHFRSVSVERDLADLERVYATPEGFLNATQKVTFTTLFHEEQYRVVSAYYTNTDPKDDNGYVFPYTTYGNLTEKAFKGYEDRLKSRRLYDTGYTLLYENYCLTINVPSDFMPHFRFVLVCIKSPSKLVRSEKAEPNQIIHYPAAWYEANHQDNPYFLSGKWYPEIITNDKIGATKKLTASDF